MWANYDVAGSVKGTELDTSTSYLSALLCHEAGIPMTDRQKAAYLLMEDVPKINVVGAYLAKNSKHDGEWENVDALISAIQEPVRHWAEYLLDGREAGERRLNGDCQQLSA